MTAQSTKDLEREAEQRRAEMAETADRLRARLTPGQLLDELAHTLRGGDLSSAASNLGAQVRDNPLGLALVGAGIACMAAGVPGPASRSGVTGGARPGSHAVGMPPANGGAIRDTAAEIGDRASAAVSATGDRLSATTSAAAGLARETGDRTREAVRSIEDEVSGVLRREPLVVGAIGLAIGAAIGALLPESRFEERQLGPLKDRVRQTGSEAVKGAVGEARAVAAAAGHAAMDKAERDGLFVSEDEARRAERVGKAADRTLGKTADALPGASYSKRPPETGTDR